MAQAAENNLIVARLADDIAKRSARPADSRLFRRVKEAASAGLKAHQYVRTNQFEVDATLDGLIEKFSILNRDDLADALTDRLIELRGASRNKWVPELLSLLLNLADRPERASTAEALELLGQPSSPASLLSWSELQAQEPLVGELWQDESYSSASEPDLESLQDCESDQLDNDDDAGLAPEISTRRLLTRRLPTEQLEDLEAAQFWQGEMPETSPQLLTELQVIRETLFMLHGLPTTIFTMDAQRDLVHQTSKVTMIQVSQRSLDDLLTSFASIGSALLRLRNWSRRHRRAPVLQTLSYAVTARIRSFDVQIAHTEGQYLEPSSPVVASLTRIHREVWSYSKDLQRLATFTSDICRTNDEGIALEALFHRICAVQAAGDYDGYTLFGEIFFSCLQVYLRPVMLWMEQGLLNEEIQDFLITISDRASVAGSLWHGRYTFRRSLKGTVHAPSFLQPHVEQILLTGKSMVFLSELRQPLPSTARQTNSMDFESVCGSDPGCGLLPFSELLESAFRSWMSSRYGPVSSILKQHLIENCGLLRYLETLEQIYCCRDSVIFEAFATKLSKRIDDLETDWTDEFVLSELTRQTLLSCAKARLPSIRTRCTRLKHNRRSIGAVGCLIVNVTLPWHIQNALQGSSIAVYQRVLILLLQIHRAGFLLREVQSELRTNSHGLVRESHAIRRRLLWFTNALQAYVNGTVLRPAMDKLHADMLSAQDFDTMCKSHEVFVAGIQQQCLLSAKLSPILGSIMSILELAVLYRDVYRRTSKRVHLNNNAQGQALTRETIRRTRKKHSQSPTSAEQLSENSSSDDGEADLGPDNYVPEAEYAQQRPEEALKRIRDQLDASLRLITAGLRSINRAGGEAAWEMFAEELEWGVHVSTTHLSIRA